MRIAVTGGIADGKSTVCSNLAELGYPVMSADDIVAVLYGNPAVVDKVKSAFSDQIVNQGAIDRDALRQEITTDPTARAKLNAIFHSAVMREILERTDTKSIAFAEVPLLIETATQGWFDEVWVVAAGPTEQRRRLIERLKSAGDADALLATQLPTDAKIPFADRVIRTNVTVETVKSTIA